MARSPTGGRSRKPTSARCCWNGWPGSTGWPAPTGRRGSCPRPSSARSPRRPSAATTACEGATSQPQAKAIESGRGRPTAAGGGLALPSLGGQPAAFTAGLGQLAVMMGQVATSGARAGKPQNSGARTRLLRGEAEDRGRVPAPGSCYLVGAAAGLQQDLLQGAGVPLDAGHARPVGAEHQPAAQSPQRPSVIVGQP